MRDCSRRDRCGASHLLRNLIVCQRQRAFLGSANRLVQLLPLLFRGLYRGQLISGEPFEVGFRPHRDASRRHIYDAIAHVRGGIEKGKRWHDAGRRENKVNTFTDFIAVAEYKLTKAGYGAPGRIVALGDSAGGTLMGAVANMRPDLFAGIVARVPFVDVLNTLLDPDLPMTDRDYRNSAIRPTILSAYWTIAGYAPYDNVKAQPYPPMLVTAGLSDPRTQYWEPAKWVAKLRAMRSLRSQPPFRQSYCLPEAARVSLAPLNRLVELLPLLFRGLYRGQLISGEPFEVGFDLIAMHHVDIFMMPSPTSAAGSKKASVGTMPGAARTRSTPSRISSRSPNI